MGCAASREASRPHNHHRHGRHHPSSSYYDWDKKEGGYIPYQHQGQHRRRGHREDKEAHAQKAKLDVHYKEHVRRKRAEAYGQQVRDVAEREQNREALKYYDVHSRKEKLRRPHDEERRRRAAAGKTEEIRVYASPDLKSTWSE